MSIQTFKFEFISIHFLSLKFFPLVLFLLLKFFSFFFLSLSSVYLLSLCSGSMISTLYSSSYLSLWARRLSQLTSGGRKKQWDGWGGARVWGGEWGSEKAKLYAMDNAATMDCFAKVGVFFATVAAELVFFLTDAWWMGGILYCSILGFPKSFGAFLWSLD